MHSVSYFLVAAFHLEMNCSGSANSLYSPARGEAEGGGEGGGWGCGWGCWWWGGRGRRGSISLYSPPSNSDPGTITLSSEHLVRG